MLRDLRALCWGVLGLFLAVVSSSDVIPVFLNKTADIFVLQ
jgi:hypothetical protein